jgi:uncharacterized membrane protein
MAGVSFELQKLLQKGTLTSTIRAFLYGTVLAAGPLLLTIITVGVIAWLSYGMLQEGPFRLFTVTVVYTFAFTLILTGPFQLVFTRYVADKHFTRDFDHIFPGFITSLAVVSVVALGFSIPFYATMKLTVPIAHPVLYRIAGVLTFWGVSMVWQVIGFVSTTKEYQKVTLSYLVGTILSILLASWLIRKIQVTGAVAAFAAGQWLVAILLGIIITRPLNKKRKWRWEYVEYLKRYPLVALNGFFFNLGIWVDKFIFWLYFHEQQGSNYFLTFNFYDVPNFLAFVSIVPALTYFLLLTETDFYKDYSRFIDDILHEPLILIEQKKQDMIDTLKKGMGGMLKVQGISTLLLIIFAQPLVIFLGYGGISIWLFRILLIGVFFHVINMNLNIIFLYYEMRRKAFFLMLGFAVSNAVLTFLSILAGPRYFGTGFLASTLVFSVLSWKILVRSIEQIDFYVYASQPIGAVVLVTRLPIWKRLLRKIRKRWVNGREFQPEFYS